MRTAAQARARHDTGRAGLRLIGEGLTVPLVTGGVRRYANLDNAASKPCLLAVKEAVDALLPWYSSVHRGAGFPSRVSTAAYEGAREAVLDFLAGVRGVVLPSASRSVLGAGPQPAAVRAAAAALRDELAAGAIASPAVP